MRWQTGKPVHKGEYVVSIGFVQQKLFRLLFWHRDAWWYHDDNTSQVGAQIIKWAGPLIEPMEFDL